MKSTSKTGKTEQDIDVAVDRLLEILAQRHSGDGLAAPMLRDSELAQVGAFQSAQLQYALRARGSRRVALLRVSLLSASLATIAQAIARSSRVPGGPEFAASGTEIVFVSTVAVGLLFVSFFAAVCSESIIRRHILYYAAGVRRESHDEIIADVFGDFGRAGSLPIARIALETGVPVLGVVSRISTRRERGRRTLRRLASYLSGYAILRMLMWRLLVVHSALEWVAQVLLPLAVAVVAFGSGLRICGGWTGMLDLFARAWSSV